MPVASKSNARGCLHKLVVQNFKSYAGIMTLGPFKDFTCVIGPNGSGKSNLMDAVSFVVGVNTAQLRGTKLADFRSNLPTATDAPTSVTLFYHGVRQPGEKNPPETQFTRTVTNHDANEWRIDGKKVGAEEYQRRLKAVGLLVKPRNFLVFQNEVEAIAQKSPKQLTELLERISGSEDLKQEYEELQEKKAEAAQAAVAVYKRSLVISNERKLLKDQVKEAMNYKDLQDKEIDLKIRRFLFDLFHIEKQMATHADEAESHAAKLKVCEGDCKAVNKALDKKMKQKAELEKEWAGLDMKVQKEEKIIKNMRTRDMLQTDEFLDGKKSLLTKFESEIETIQKKNKEYKRNVGPQEKTLTQLQSELSRLQDKEKSKGFEASGMQVSKYNQLKQQANVQTHKAKVARDKTLREDQGDQMELEREKGELSRCENRLNSLEAKITSAQEDRTIYEREINAAGEKEHAARSKLTDVEKDLKQDSAQHRVLQENEKEMQAKLTDARVDEKHARNEEDKNRVVEHLSQAFPGVRGRVMDLCKVKQRTHELAITVLMENNMDSIVVEREETAKSCVQYLREQRKRPMTFLPLDVIKASQPDERLRMIPGAKLALDLIDYGKENEKVMWFVTGNAVVVNTLEEAKRLAFGSAAPKCKIVTLDANIISKTGVMTGGDPSYLTNKAQRWQRQEFEKLKEHANATLKDLNTVKGRIDHRQREKLGLERELSQYADKLKDLKKKKTDCDAIINTSKKEIESVKKQMSKIDESIKAVKARIQERALTLKKEQEALDKVNDEIFKDFCSELGIENIKVFEGGSLEEHKARIKQALELSMQIGKVQNAIAKMKETIQSLEQQEASKTADVASIQKDIKSLKDQKKDLEGKIGRALEAKAEEERKRNVVKGNIDTIDKEVRDVQNVSKIAHDARESVVRQVDRAVSKMESLRSQRKNIIDQCAMDEISLPKKGRDRGGTGEDGEDADDDPMSVETNTCSHSQPAKEAKDEIASDRFDYTKLTREQRRELSPSEQSKVREKLEEEQVKITETLNSLNPNMKAMDQLKEVEVRYQAVVEESKAAKETSQSLAKKFEDVKNTRGDLFNACFEHVKGCIDSIYKELTSEPSKIEHSVGGSAYLTLNNQEEPYLDGIKYDTIPPGKRFMDMAHLSGGEKTVAALALLFSINSFSPAPFIVLDEVDAALDARNVAKVTRYIQSRRKEQQCVIISLKERFYEKADALVGICRDITGGHSKVFTLDLTVYVQ